MGALAFDPEILKIYQRSFFQVKDSEGQLVRFKIKTLKRFPDISRKVFVVITAWNPMNEVLPLKTNRALNQELAEQLMKLGVVFYRTKGWFGPHCEEGFTVEGLRASVAIALGCEFRQYAILFNDYRGPRFLRCWSEPFLGKKKLGAALKQR